MLTIIKKNNTAMLSKSTIDYLILIIPNLSENNKYTGNIPTHNTNNDITTSSYKNIRILTIVIYILAIFKQIQKNNVTISYRKSFRQSNRARQVQAARVYVK